MQILLLVALAPAIALLTFFYIRDKYEREPLKQVIKVFFLGVAIVFPAVLFEMIGEKIFPSPSISHDWVDIFIHAFVVVALVEEGLKFLAVLVLPVQKIPTGTGDKKLASIYNSPDFNEPYDGITYSVSASLGFAALENIFYVFQSGIGTGILRAVLSVPGHALFGVAMGYFIGKAKFSQDKQGMLLFFGLAIATGLHGLYDFLLMTEHTGMVLLVLPLMIGMWVLGLRQVKSAQKASPFNPALTGVNQPIPQSDITSVPTSESQSVVPPTPIVSQPGITETSLAHCPFCGSQLKPGSSFCSQCGGKIS